MDTIKLKQSIKYFPVLFLVFFTACGLTSLKHHQDEDAKMTVNKGWQLMESHEFAVQYPANWQLNQDGLMGTKFILFSPVDSTQKDFRPSINLVVQDLKGANLTVDMFEATSSEQIKKIIPNCTVLESGVIGDGANQHGKLLYTGDQLGRHLEYEQYYWVANGNAYVLTLCNTQDKFADTKGTGEGILNSFVIKQM